MSRACVLRVLYEGGDDQAIAEAALRSSELPQPESLERFVRAARRTGNWSAAAANALLQLFDVQARSRRW